MKYILDPEAHDDLLSFARATVLVAFDYDGTLAPIVSDPEKAELRATTRALLDQVTKLYPCAVISGRARSDTLQRLGNVQLWAASGNHGAETFGITEDYERRVKDWAAIFRHRLGGLPGVMIEDKGFSISVHYRNATDPEAALTAIEDVARGLPNARVLGGKMVVNVVPDEAPHKGIALDCIRRWSGCDRAIYVGDDVTDEDAFDLPPEQVLAIRIGNSGMTKARYHLKSQTEIDRFLVELIKIRTTRLAVA